MKKDSFLEYISITLILLLGILFVVKFGGPATLRLYIQTGIGDCQKIPILCMSPEEKIINPPIDKEYISELLPYKFPKIAIYIPKGFTVVQDKITKVYYKKKKRQHGDATIYLFHQEPNFFISLFPRSAKQGIKDNYEFMKRTMYAKLNEIKNLDDTFFVIVKSIFTPDLGEQRNVKMAQFSIADKKGFINYSLAQTSRYFDCNIINNNGDVFKVYIKDKAATLDLNKVLAIISTVKTQWEIAEIFLNNTAISD